ncbi:hypothetical protein [Streptomyces marianii]|uniref:Uncharacterized protein n=1 Tax=Streptomyces marianii TaxID=1817406 RepID=A0A5R9DS24_9ACTN|nr:hypothetical protein [Streptomyces marianii]TLQ38763.1 hypothetical protein FEF34_40770 [Streptomyces marianii]
MRTKDVRVGQTYRCEVPFSLPYRRYRPETMGDSWWPLTWLRGSYFPLTVTDVDTEARTAQGLRMASTTRITVKLTEDQVEAAGLPLGHGYQVTGMLLDVEGEPVELPRIAALTVPVRWLHPMDTPVSAGHHDASIRGIG